MGKSSRTRSPDGLALLGNHAYLLGIALHCTQGRLLWHNDGNCDERMMLERHSFDRNGN